MSNIEEQTPLEQIRNKNLESIGQLDEVMSTTLQNKFSRALSAGFGIIVQYLLYVIALGVFLFIFIMEKVSPFYILSQMRNSSVINDELNPHMIDSFSLTYKVTIGLVALFIFTTGYFIGRIRKYKGSIQDSIEVLKDVKQDIKGNNELIDEMDEASNKLVAAAQVVANEAKI